MVTKDEAFHPIKAFAKMAQTQFSAIVKIIRTENALKLEKSHAALNFFTSTGILHQTSCVQTPQQNGAVKRKHKHLLKVSMLSLPIKIIPEFLG